MEKNSRTEMLPGKRDFYLCCIERGVAPHTRFWQQFQNYAPPSLRVKRTKFARTILYLISRVRVEYVIVKARQRGNYAANSPSPRALVRVRGR